MPGKANKKSAVLWAVLLVAGFCIGGLIFGAYKYRLSELTLHADKDGNLLEQRQEPTEFEKEVGRNAVAKFKDCPQEKRYQLAYDMVRGKSLLGMGGTEVMDVLGTPDDTEATTKYLIRYHTPTADYPTCDLAVGLRGAEVVYSCLHIEGY